jgi:hypothetical protein
MYLETPTWQTTLQITRTSATSSPQLKPTHKPNEILKSLTLICFSTVRLFLSTSNAMVRLLQTTTLLSLSTHLLNLTSWLEESSTSSLRPQTWFSHVQAPAKRSNSRWLSLCRPQLRATCDSLRTRQTNHQPITKLLQLVSCRVALTEAQYWPAKYWCT